MVHHKDYFFYNFFFRILYLWFICFIIFLFFYYLKTNILCYSFTDASTHWTILTFHFNFTITYKSYDLFYVIILSINFSTLLKHIQQSSNIFLCLKFVFLYKTNYFLYIKSLIFNPDLLYITLCFEIYFI